MSSRIVTRILTTVLIAFTLLSGITCIVKVQRSRTCQLSREEAERCGLQVMVFGNRDVQYPNNMAEAWKFCKKIEEGIDCVAKYKYCVSGFKRNLVTAFASFIRKEFKSYCNSEILPLLIAQSKCLDREKVRSEDFVACVDKNVLMSDFVRANVSAGEQLPALCCAFAHYRDCNHRFTESVCANIVGEEAAKFLDNMVVKMFSTFSNCSEKFTSLESCLINLKGPAEAFEKISADTVPPQNHSVLLTFLDILGD